MIFFVFEIWSILYSKSVNFQLILSTKLTINQKINVGKLIFHSFQHIAHFSCKFGNFWPIFFGRWHLKIIGFFPTKDVQTPPLRSGHSYMKDAECAESNEKSIFRFLFYELWSFLYANFRWIFKITRIIKIRKLFFHSILCNRTRRKK